MKTLWGVERNMKLNKLPLLLTSLILLILNACNGSATIQTSTPLPVPSRATIASLPVFTETIEPTPTEWLPFNPNIVNTDECAKLVPKTIPVAGTENLLHEEIAQKLFALYLEKHITLEPHHVCKLESYRIEKTTADKKIDFLAKEQDVGFVNRVVFSVQILEVPSSWVTGNGEFAPDGWIVHKALIIGVTKVGDQYILKLIGTGP
jgi:hypothetical protein